MQTKAFPLFPIATWPRGNCLISNFGQLPEGRESRVYKISHVFTAHGGSDFFSPPPPPAAVLLGVLSERVGPPATKPLPLHTHTGMCTCVCGHVLQRGGHSETRSTREGKFEKQELPCEGKPASPSHAAEETKQTGRQAKLRVQMCKVEFALAESFTPRASKHTAYNF